MRRAALLGLLLAAPAPAAAERLDEPVSAFAANVGVREPGAEPAPGVTLYVVPDSSS